MVEYQIISKIVVNKDVRLLTDYNLEYKHFTQYADAFKFIKQHFDTYKVIPDLETFYSSVQLENELVSVEDSDDYLVNELLKDFKIRCTNLFLNNISEIGSTDIDSALRYASANIPQIASIGDTEPINLIATATDRYDKYIDKCNNPRGYFIQTGFPELDDVLGGGFSRDMDLVILFARTGVGKTMLMMQFLQHSFKLGMRTMVIEPEMNETQIGYRFDTAYAHISSTGLFKGGELNIDYAKYINELKQNKTPIYYKAPQHYGLRITPEKIKRDIEKYKLDILFIDGINYLNTDKYYKNKKRFEELQEISYALSQISEEYRIPIIVVNQANRDGAKDGNEPELEAQSMSDGINFSASRIISLANKQEDFVIAIKKNRFGSSGKKLKYLWDADKGIFTCNDNKVQINGITRRQLQQKNKGDIF